MHRDHVISAAIVSIGYDAETSTLEVEFEGGAVYDYLNVPKAVYFEFFQSDSKGAFFGAHVRDHFQYAHKEKPRQAGADLA